MIDTPELFKSVRRKLAAFYAVCKSNVAQLRFFFMTGITKFNQADSCSELDDLVDISIDPMYGDIVGVTELEIRKYFSPYLKDAARRWGFQKTERFRSCASTMAAIASMRMPLSTCIPLGLC